MTYQEDSVGLAFLKWVTDAAVEDFGPLPSASKLASDCRKQFKDPEEAIAHVTGWTVAMAGVSGFITGAPGLAALPITVPAEIGVGYLLGGRLAAVIAHLRGWDLESQAVRTAIGMCLLGDVALEATKQVGIGMGMNVSKTLISQISKNTINEINQLVGFRLLSKAGTQGALCLTKLVPIVGGVVGATFESTFVHGCGEAAKKLFVPKDEQVRKAVYGSA